MSKALHPTVALAATFAVAAHSAREQVRKYTGEPYFFHAENVANTVAQVPGATAEMVAAAWLHDVVEDCSISPALIESFFGEKVATLVVECSHVDRANDPRKLNRFERMAIELARAADISPEAKTIKLADLIDNTSTIVQHDPKFAKVYMAEKRRLLKVLDGGDAGLHARARACVDEYFAQAAAILPPGVYLNGERIGDMVVRLDAVSPGVNIDAPHEVPEPVNEAPPVEDRPWNPGSVKPASERIYERKRSLATFGPLASMGSAGKCCR